MARGHPLVLALGATTALGLLIGAGVTCSFVDVRAKEGELIAILETSEQEARTSTSLGILCEGDFYSLQDDIMWFLSRIFFFAALACGGVAVLVTWGISTVALPTNSLWKFISGSSAVVCVLQVPIFLMFETEPCVDYKSQQECVLSTGAYLIVASAATWLFVTLITQFCDPPAWVYDLKYWRNDMGGNGGGDDSMETQGLGSSVTYATRPPSAGGSTIFHNLRRWQLRRQFTARGRGNTFLGDEEEGIGGIKSVALRNVVVGEAVAGVRAEAAASALKTFNKTFDGPPPSFASDSSTDTVPHVPSSTSDSGTDSAPLVSSSTSDNSADQLATRADLSQAVDDHTGLLLSDPKYTKTIVHNSDIVRLAPIALNMQEDNEELMQSVDDQPAVLLSVPRYPKARADEEAGLVRVVSSKTGLTHSFEDQPKAFQSVEDADLEPVVSKQTAEESHRGESPDSSKLSLGSLVSNVSGTESILDNTAEADERDGGEQREKTVPAGPESAEIFHKTREERALVPTGILALTQKVGLGIARAREGTGYQLMDDDESRSLSPPLEIITLSTQDEDATLADDEERLLHDDWNRLHGLEGPALLDLVEDAEALSSYYDEDPEPVLHFSDDSDNEKHVVDATASELEDVTDPSKETIDVPSTTHRAANPKIRKRRRKKKGRKNQSGLSVASSPSTLNTVAEETMKDLEEDCEEEEVTSAFDPYSADFALKRSISAPNLPSFAAGTTCESSKVSEDVIMTGMNSFNRTEMWRGDQQKKAEPESGNVKVDSTISAPNLASFALRTTCDSSKVSEDVTMTGMNSFNRTETWRSNQPKEAEPESGNVKDDSTISAPHLASFAPGTTCDSAKVSEDVIMTGMNSFNRIETWRGDEPKKAVPESEDMKDDSSLQDATTDQVERVEKSTPPKIPVFKEERDIRGGIHDTLIVSGESSEDNGSERASTRSLDARRARIRRLQLDRNRPPRSRTLDPPRRKRRPVFNDDTNAVLWKKSPIDEETVHPVLEKRSLVMNDDANTIQSNRSLLVNDDSTDILLDALDLDLVEFQRPDGMEYGPEERSL